MNVIVIASLIAVGTVILGALIAIVFRAFNRAVVNEQQAADREMRSYNPALTFGHKIPVDADPQTQLKAARREAARRAVMMPRGANAVIGRSNGGKVKSAYHGLQNDPVSAVKIAAIHSWEGVRTGSAFSPAQSVTHAEAATAPPTKSADDLIPGEDYPVIEITDDMSPAEKRKARIANVKAKAAAAKQLKASAAAAPSEAAALAPEAVAPAREPVAGEDYEVIEITDDMSPDEVRKARIANVKAKAAAMKAFKAAGGAATAPSQMEEATASQPTAEAKTAAPAAVPTDIEPPDLIAITDDMAPEDVRKARIHNAKAQAAYKKALKEAGIDPSSVA